MGGAILDRLARDCLFQMSAFEQGPESSDGWSKSYGYLEEDHSNLKE